MVQPKAVEIDPDVDLLRLIDGCGRRLPMIAQGFVELPILVRQAELASLENSR